MLKPEFCSRRRALLIVAFLSGAASFGALAASDSETQLGEMVVKGEKASGVPRNLPAVSEGISASQMEETINVVNTEDALKYMPSLQIRKRFIGDTNGIVASRSSGTLVSARSLVYADNLLLSNLLGNSFAYPPRWGLVTPEEIERIDVIYGPFSAEYPGNAMGAVINMTTRMPEKFEAHAKTQAFRQNFKVYGTDESYSGNQTSAALGNRVGALSWWASFNHIDSHGQPMSFATKALSTTAAGGGDTVVSGAYRDRDAEGKGRVVLGATSITHTIQDHAKLKFAYDITPQFQASYTLGWWKNDSESKVESYLRNAAGAPVYSGNVNIGGMRYNLANTDLNPSRGEQQHWLHGMALKTKTGGEWDWELA
ncbi:MAG: TonB-dependent receptor plug domain-containing protein, partial [Rhodocyclaceae bacterium]